jgi:hypothetical protein
MVELICHILRDAPQSFALCGEFFANGVPRAPGSCPNRVV